MKHLRPIATAVLQLWPVAIHPLWQLVFYMAALSLLVAISFWTLENYQLVPVWTTENYRQIAARPFFWAGLWASFLLALTAGSLAVVFALPAAVALAFHVTGRARTFLLFALLLPFFSNYVVRMFAWQLWLNDNGLLAGLLRWLGLLRGPLYLIYTTPAVLVGLLSVLVPIAALAIFLSLARLDPTLPQAARNLGASPWQVFWHVHLPFALPGMLVGFLFCFILAFGDFVCPSILGGNQVSVVSTLIKDRIKINDWPAAAALGSVMALLLLSVLALVFGVLSRLPVIRSGRGGAQQ
jgi:spermidine/putrescine transport system permease protein